MNRAHGVRIQGRRLWDAMVTSLGKRKTQILVVGTLAPAPLTGPASWWPSLVAEGSGDGRHVALLQADAELWRDFDEVLRVNPVSAINPHLRRVLEREHKAALAIRTGGSNLPSIQAQHSRRSRRIAAPNHCGGMGAGMRAACSSLRREADYRRRSWRQSQLERMLSRVPEWPNRGVGDCAGSAVARRPGARRPGSGRLLFGVGTVGRAVR